MDASSGQKPNSSSAPRRKIIQFKTEHNNTQRQTRLLLHGYPDQGYIIRVW